MTAHEEDFVRGRGIAFLVHALDLLGEVLPLRETRWNGALVLEAEVGRSLGAISIRQLL